MVFSQLTVINNNIAASLAQAILGNGITISNATLNGGFNSTGLFSYTGNNLGLSDGIILTTGLAQSAANPGGYFCDITNNNNFSDPDLTAISSRARYDVCILEFDFVPLCDTLKMEYVFGSEEYPKRLHQVYNDIFAIFLTGPQPGGGAYASKNIATLPNGFTPVSIDSVNEGWPAGANTHSDYYYDNYTTRNNDIAYDGYTLPVSSKAALVACSKYHMKIAIADAANGRYDSGVFIKGNSFGCRVAPAITTSTLFVCPDKGSAAVQVTDYTGTPTYTWYPGGEHTDSLANIASGTYTCIVSLPGLCSDFTVTASIPSSPQVTVNASATAICRGQPVQLGASGGSSFTWTPAAGLNDAYIANPIASPSVTTTYSVQGQAESGCNSMGQVTLQVPDVPLQAGFTASSYDADIDNADIQFTDNSNGAIGWNWNFSEAPGSTLQDPLHIFIQPGTYLVTLVASDAYNCTDTVSKLVVIHDIIPDLFTFYAPNAFTPNGDGNNELFLPLGVGWDESTYQIDIYDRWGSNVFSNNDAHKGWNGLVKGQTAKQDIYIWKAYLKDIYKREHYYTGHVALLR